VKGCQGSNQGGFGAIIFKSHVFCNDYVDWYGLLFWREGFLPFGILAYKYGFQNK